MEYISTYLREYAERYSDFSDVECHMVTCNDGSTHQVYTTLPTLLLESAAKIDELNRKLKELEYVEKIIKVAGGSQ